MKNVGMRQHNLRGPGLGWVKLLHCSLHLVNGGVTAAPNPRKGQNKTVRAQKRE